MNFFPLPKEMVVSNKGQFGSPVYVGCFLPDGRVAVVSGKHQQSMVCGLWNFALTSVTTHPLPALQPYRLTSLPDGRLLLACLWSGPKLAHHAALINTADKVSLVITDQPIFDALVLDDQRVLMASHCEYANEYHSRKLNIVSRWGDKESLSLLDQTGGERSFAFADALRKINPEVRIIGTSLHVMRMIETDPHRLFLAIGGLHRGGSGESAFVVLDDAGHPLKAWAAEQTNVATQLQMVFDGCRIWMQTPEGLIVKDKEWNTLATYSGNDNPFVGSFKLLSAARNGQMLWFSNRKKLLCRTTSDDTKDLSSFPQRFTKEIP